MDPEFRELAAVAELTAAATKVYSRLRTSFADTVDELVEGSVVFQDLDLPILEDVFEHSGIYVGDHKVVSLSKDGDIVEESTRELVERETDSSKPIWVSCKGSAAVGSPRVAARARKKVGKRRGYNFVLDNCHQFTSGCLTGDFENADNFMTFLKMTAGSVLGADNWRVWDRDGTVQRTCDNAIREISRDGRLLKELIDADFEEREKLLRASFDRLGGSYAIKDADGFVDGLAAIAKAFGGDLPWQDATAFDEMMQVAGPASLGKRHPPSGPIGSRRTET